MSDFSQYGGPSDEWLAVAADLPVPPKLGLAELKKTTNEGREAVSAQDMKSLAKDLIIHDYSIPTRDGSVVEGRSYKPEQLSGEPSLPVYLHLHGGGFMFGTLSSEDAACARIALATDVLVVNVNYRHTPEFTYPTAWQDVEDAFVWLHQHIQELGGDAERVVVGGISAGAHLTASLVLGKHLGRLATNLPDIRGQVLMIPAVVNMNCYSKMLAQLSDPSVSSYKENENAPIIPVNTVLKMFTEMLKVEDPNENDLLLNPGNASSAQIKGLPPSTFGIAGLDPLRDEGLIYAKLLAEAGYVEKCI
jgi:acetyl esterase/lipase